MIRANVLASATRPTTKSYRFAVAQMIDRVKVRCRLGPQALSERIGCSAGTITNAEDEKNDLSPVFLLAFALEFGLDVLDPVLALAGGRAIPIAERCGDISRAPLTISEALHRLLETQCATSDGGAEITTAELMPLLPFLRDARAVLDGMIDRAEHA